jgi:hypothetical protein
MHIQMAYYMICISLSGWKMSTSERSLVGSQPQYMRKLLSVVKCKVQTSCDDVTMRHTVDVLRCLTCEFLHTKHIGDRACFWLLWRWCCWVLPYCNEVSKCALSMHVVVSSEFLQTAYGWHNNSQWEKSKL